MREEENLKK